MEIKDESLNELCGVNLLYGGTDYGVSVLTRKFDEKTKTMSVEEWYEAAGYVAATIGSFYLLGKLGSGAKAGEAGEAAEAAEELTEVEALVESTEGTINAANEAEEAANAANKLEESVNALNKVDDTAKAAGEVGEASKAAEAAKEGAEVKALTETADDAAKIADKYTGGRTEAELEALAKDPAHIGSKREIDIVKGHHEAEVGLDLERRGLLENIKRDPTGAAEFIEENGTKWDVKSFNSNYPVKKGGFELNRVMRTINKSLEKQENVIVDTLNMSQEHITELKAAVKANGIDDKVIFWP